MRELLRTGILVWGMLLLLVACAALAQADDALTVEEIQRAIVEKGAQWEARETSVMRLSPEERRRLCGAQSPVPDPRDIKPPPLSFPQTTSLIKLDWRDYNGHNWTTSIRDQAGCGSCVAFGCMAAFEASISIYFGAPEPTFDLSEQHLFSCGGGSCEYGWNVVPCYNFLMSQGAPDEDCYPYRAMDNSSGAPCSETCGDWQMRARKVSGWGVVTPYSEIDIKNALLNSPVAAYLRVYNDFYGYSSGVYERTSDVVEGGHIIAIVGWDDEEDSWICKNSWGEDWGEAGWFRIRKGTNESEIESYVAWVVPEPANYPSLKFHDYAVEDTQGDGDGVLNPGETVLLQVSLQNQQTWATATDVSATLSCSDPRITILDSLATFQGDIFSGQTAWNTTDEFRVSVDEDAGVCEIPLFLDVSANAGNYHVILDFNLQVSYDQHGWPVNVGTAVRSSPVLMNVDTDAEKEVIAVDYLGSLHMWDRLGQEEPGFPVDVSGTVWGSPAVGDVDDDGHLDIVFASSNDTVYAFTNSGSRLFARGVGGAVLSTPALADLDGNGHLETIVGALDGYLYALKDDGTDYGPFPVSLGGATFASPAVFRLDDDGVLDIIIGNVNKDVHAVSSSDGQSLPGFPLTTGGMVISAPSVADLDEDGHNEIAIGCDDGFLYVIDHLGGVQFALSSGHMVRSSPAIGDVDGDDHLDIVFGSKNGKVFAVDSGGNILSGWPFQAQGFIETSPALVDLDGDNRPEVIFGTAAEKMYILAGDGSPLAEYPTPPFGAIYSSAAIVDLDGDGDFEIALGTPEGLSIWDYKSMAGSQMPWPMYRGNCRRTGYFGDNIGTSVGGNSAYAAPPRQYALSQNYPNPFNAETQIRFFLPEESQLTLEIFNILGQRVITLARGLYETGEHRVTWDGKDSGGAQAASGVYFCRLQAGKFRGIKRIVLLR